MSLLGELEPAQNGVLAGIRDMLITELFGSGRFIVLERDALDAILSEQEFSHSAKVGDATRIPRAQLEGADLVVVGALTAFDAGASGGALPIPIPLSDRGDWGVLNLSAKRGHVAMDLRVIEVSTGRVIHSTAVEGRNWSMGLDFAGLFRSGHRVVRLPGLLRLFSNTPVEEALQKMVTAATLRIAEAATN
jgi:curli biogenesis system outer membrane secretion channel CsgG